jgi:uracil-DNA glycosylase family 4
VSTVVPGFGGLPADVLLCGEAPGRQEAELGRPFVGRSGEAQDEYLRRHGLSSRGWYLTNVSKTYNDGNPDPTPEEIDRWTPVLLDEVRRCQPRLIVAVGRFAARWFLGDDATMDDVWGIPHRAGALDAARRDRAPADAVIVPIMHPALGFHQKDARAVINEGYARLADIYERVRAGRKIPFRVDPFAGKEDYRDVTGAQLAECLAADRPHKIAIDTEGVPDNPWSIQVCTSPGTAYVLRCRQPDFAVGIAALQRLIDTGIIVAVHDAGTSMGCCYDTQMCRAMDLELCDANLRNTMYRAFATRLEPKGLKALCWRFLGMRMTDYMSLVGGISRQKQIAYLERVAAESWEPPGFRTRHINDGTVKIGKPRAIGPSAAAVLRDIASGKLNKKGEPTDPYKRWAKFDAALKAQVTRRLGKMPVATLDDVDRKLAVFYAGRDADGTYRLDEADQLPAAVEAIGASGVCATGDQVLPVFEEMQRTGMPASRRAFQELHDRMDREMKVIGSRISHLYYDDRPFNPKSDPQVRALLRRRGLRAMKLTKGGEDSTAKKSIEHLRAVDPAIDDVFSWREREKIRGTYCRPLLRIADREIRRSGDATRDWFMARGKLKPVSVETRRLAGEDPSLLNVPGRTELGRQVRACYVIPPEWGDYVFGAWDFSGQEMRVAAHVADEQLLIKLFSFCRHCGQDLRSIAVLKSPCRKSETGRHEGGDPHTEAAMRIFGVQREDVDKFQHRLPAKTANFGILYGLSGMGLQDTFRQNGLTWSVDDCKRLIDEILHKVYPGLLAAIRAIQAETYRTGRVSDLYGMVRYLPLIWSRSRAEAAEAARQAFSMVVQGTAQGQIQNAMAWLRPRIKDIQKVGGVDVRWALQIHDELVFIFPRWMWGVMDPLVTEAFRERTGLRLKVPIETDSHVATSWSALK